MLLTNAKRQSVSRTAKLVLIFIVEHAAFGFLMKEKQFYEIWSRETVKWKIPSQAVATASTAISTYCFLCLFRKPYQGFFVEIKLFWHRLLLMFCRKISNRFTCRWKGFVRLVNWAPSLKLGFKLNEATGKTFALSPSSWSVNSSAGIIKFREQLSAGEQT